MDQTKQPGINIIGIILANEEFQRGYLIPEDAELKLNFNVNYDMNKEKTNASTEITTTLELLDKEGKQKKVLSLKFTYVGIFSVSENPNMDMETFIKNNSAAILYPYIREHITNITQKSGIKPIILAPTNIIACLNNKEEITKEDITEDVAG